MIFCVCAVCGWAAGEVGVWVGVGGVCGWVGGGVGGPRATGGARAERLFRCSMWPYRHALPCDRGVLVTWRAAITACPACRPAGNNLTPLPAPTPFHGRRQASRFRERGVTGAEFVRLTDGEGTAVAGVRP